MQNIRATFAILALLLFPALSQASVTLLDRDDWKFLFGGFVETDIFNDSARSFTEVVGNNPIDRPNSYNGDNGRTQFSLRNSRFAFTLLPPTKDDLKTKGYLEFDLLGYDPTVSNTGTTNSESSFYTNPSVRLRHAYFSVEKNDMQVLVGQYWTLFGWQPYYVAATASVPPVSGVSYERTPQATVLENIKLNDTDKVQGAVSVSRPSQRDGNMPNIDAGVRYLVGSRRSGFASPSGDATAEPMSFAVSGTYRNFETPSTNGTTATTSTFATSALAVDALIPVLASSDGKETAGTLSVLGEYTSGSGYADEFPGWSGNLAQLATGSQPSLNPNLDAGQAGFDGSGNFQFVKIQSFNVQAQYHLPTEDHWFVNAGYGQLYSNNIANLAPAASGKTTYDRADVYFVNMFHDCNQWIRVALEYDRFSTQYTDLVSAFDNRYQVSAWFRF